MKPLSETQNPTPVLDHLLAQYRKPCLTCMLPFSDSVMEIRDSLFAKAAEGALTRDDIEDALSKVPNNRSSNIQQMQLLQVLDLNYHSLFIEITCAE